MSIHPTAIIDKSAELAPGVVVGPYAIINADVVIGEGTEVMAHAFIDRYTQIGKNCRIFPSASIGAEPQDTKFKGERTEVVIGDGATVREFVTVHRATGEGLKTTVGEGALLMAYAHVAHNCRIGHRVILANNVTMAGHVTIEDEATVSGLVAIHQFARVGTYAFIGGFSRVSKDMPPYLLGEGAVEFQLHGPNTIGLRRKGFSKESIGALKDVFRLVFRNHRPLQQVLDEALALYPDISEVETLVEFMRSSERGVFR